MSDLVPRYELDYRLGGSTIDEWGLGYIDNQVQLFKVLNALRENSPVPDVEPTAYEIKVEDDNIYIRNSDNTEWIKLMKVADNGGFKSDKIGKQTAGSTEAKPVTGVNNYDTYMDLDKGELSYWLDGSWHVLLTLDVTKMTGYDNLIKKDEDVVSPANTTDIVTNAQKLVQTDDNGNLPVNITGNAAKIAGAKIDAANIKDGQILAYDSATNSFKNVDKSTVGTGRSLILMNGNTLLATYNGGEVVDVDIGKIIPMELDDNGDLMPKA